MITIVSFGSTSKLGEIVKPGRAADATSRSLCPPVMWKDNEANVFETMSTGFPSADKYFLTSSSVPRAAKRWENNGWVSRGVNGDFLPSDRRLFLSSLAGTLGQSGVNNSLIIMLLKPSMMDTRDFFFIKRGCLNCSYIMLTWLWFRQDIFNT